MPITEAGVAVEPEVAHYELAFHILPTVVEGEVPTIVNKLKGLVTAHGGTITGEEAPQRFDLAYEIVKYLEGKNRKFSSAYFGWIRFSSDPEQVPALTEEVTATKELLRYLLIKLSKAEAASPFNFHESIVDKRVRTIVDLEEEVVPEEETEVVADVVAGDEVVLPEDSSDSDGSLSKTALQ